MWHTCPGSDGKEGGKGREGKGKGKGKGQGKGKGRDGTGRDGRTDHTDGRSVFSWWNTQRGRGHQLCKSHFTKSNENPLPRNRVRRGETSGDMFSRMETSGEN